MCEEVEGGGWEFWGGLAAQYGGGVGILGFKDKCGGAKHIHSSRDRTTRMLGRLPAPPTRATLQGAWEAGPVWGRGPYLLGLYRE